MGRLVPFVHLQLKSAYSILNSTIRIKQLVERAKALDYKAVALTDENVMYGAIPFYKECKKAGIKPIIGLTLYVLKQEDEAFSYPLVLLAQNEKGYENLVKLSSLVQTKEKNGVKKKWLPHYKEGVIAFTPGLSGEIESLILDNKLDEAKQTIAFFKHVYGEENFYLSLQRHGDHEQVLNEELCKLAEELNVKLLASNDVKYLVQEDYEAYECLKAIGEGDMLQDMIEEDRNSKEYYFKSQSQMESLYTDVLSTLYETNRIADRCNLELSLGKMMIPSYPIPNSQDTADSYLQKLCEEGLKKRLSTVTPEYAARLDYELSVIQQMKFSNYFLIVWDFMQYAHKNGIITGPGRGSAAGSLVAYVLEITNVDPIKHDLLFERFLNPERISMPDIDIDFPDNKRDQVIQYVAGKYGQIHVAQIITFGTLATKAAIRDVGKVIGMDKEDLSVVSKLLPSKPGVTLQQAVAQSKPLREYIQAMPIRQKLLQLAMQVEGLPRHTSTHAAGVVISGEPLTSYTPIQEGQHNVYLTQYPMEALQDIGLLKMDFLGLRNLTLIDYILAKVERDTGERQKLPDIPMQDAKTFQLLASGDTTGIFQLESDGMRKVLKELQPTELEDIVAVNALYRPGPMEHIPTYIKRKHGLEKVTYVHDVLKPILQTTYGVIVYQEQIMQIASKMAGFSLGEADLLRRAVSKKESATLQKERKHFIEGSKRQGYGEEVSEQVYDLIVKFANYGFNRSHAVAYSFITYYLAYLKAHYPLQFFAVLLTSAIGNQSKSEQYIQEMRKRKIALLPPSINQSAYAFNVEKQQIRFSLGAIKYVGGTVVQEILNERKNKPFEDLFDFCMRVSTKIVNKKILETLINAGCFDEFGENRATLIETIDVAFEHAQLVDPQDDFGMGFSLKPKYIIVDEFSEQEILEREKEAVGFYLSNHPASQYERLMEAHFTIPLCDIAKCKNGAQVSIIGLISNERIIRTKQGEQMAFLAISDETDDADAVVFPRSYEKYKQLLNVGEVVLIKGKVDIRTNKRQIVAQEIYLAKEVEEELPKQEVYLRVKPSAQSDEVIRDIYKKIHSAKGNVPVLVYYESEKRLLRLTSDYFISLEGDVITQFKALLGDENVAVKTL